MIRIHDKDYKKMMVNIRFIYILTIMSSSTECPVCYIATVLAEMPCGHAICCDACLPRWLELNRGRCPAIGCDYYEYPEVDMPDVNGMVLED